MKKFYEAPWVQMYHLCVQEDLLSLPTISGNGGFGFDDEGPADLRRADGE